MNSSTLRMLILLIQLFKRMLDQFDRLRRRNAFLEQYKRQRMFENGLEEFDDARQVVFFDLFNGFRR